MTTGIFFHYQYGERLRDFPQALDGILAKPNILFFDALYSEKQASDFDIPPVPVKMLSAVHSKNMIARIKGTGDYEGAMYSVAGTVAAATHVASGKLTNAFVFTGFGDHHAGSNFFGGGCYFNGAAIAINELREMPGLSRFAIIDTDAHHGDGTWEIFEKDSELLYVCFCCDAVRDINENLNVRVPPRLSDETYLALVKHALEEQITDFAPQIIFWNWGYDGTSGDYGDLGLSPIVHSKLAAEIRKTAEIICKGRLITILCGGSRRDFAKAMIPSIINVLST